MLITKSEVIDIVSYIKEDFFDDGYKVNEISGNYLLDVGESARQNLKIKGNKARKYIIIPCQCSDDFYKKFELIMTDSKSLFNEYYRLFMVA